MPPAAQAPQGVAAVDLTELSSISFIFLSLPAAMIVFMSGVTATPLHAHKTAGGGRSATNAATHNLLAGTSITALDPGCGCALPAHDVRTQPGPAAYHAGRLLRTHLYWQPFSTFSFSLRRSDSRHSYTAPSAPADTTLLSLLAQHIARICKPDRQRQSGAGRKNMTMLQLQWPDAAFAKG